MKGYLRGIRTYNAALKDTRLKGGTDTDWVVDLISRHFKVKPEIAREIYSQALDPNGEVIAASLKRDMEFFKEKESIERDNRSGSRDRYVFRPESRSRIENRGEIASSFDDP